MVFMPKQKAQGEPSLADHHAPGFVLLRRINPADFATLAPFAVNVFFR